MEQTEGPAPGTSQDDRVLQDVWQRTIAAIPSDFGKLVYVSSLRDSNSGIYHHYGLEAVYSGELCDRALRESHLDLLYGWLRKDLEQQKDDLEFYFRGVEGDLASILDTWERLEPYRAYVPADSDEPARQWFYSDLQIVMALLREDASRFLPR